MVTEHKEPWEKEPGIWKTQAAYFAWLRGQFRKIWNFYPPKFTWKSSMLRLPPKGYTGRAKKLGTCHYCNESFAASHLEVDHVHQAGQCNSWETSSQFLYNLLDCNNNWVLACKPCHRIKSYSESQGITFIEAAVAKQAIETMKLPVAKVLAILKKAGYTDVSNAAKMYTKQSNQGEQHGI
jgi:5-methylcytosine-specific restriction endonuclease McrA